MNPKTGSQIAFISGRTGHPQLWLMNIDGSDADMLTTGDGDVCESFLAPGRAVDRLLLDSRL